MQKFIASLSNENGVWSDPSFPVDNTFEENYLAVREKENRVYSDSEVSRLPELTGHEHSNEWKLRDKSLKRVMEYFRNFSGKTILDLGCGNGWFANKLSSVPGNLVMGLDVNRPELEQAARVFSKENLIFVNGNLFELPLPENCFDVVTLNASVQYFEKLKVLIERLFCLMAPTGEIHLIDSPFYSAEHQQQAAERTRKYYEMKGIPEMAGQYFHHTYDELKPFDHQYLYKPHKKSRILQAISGRDIPFPWIKIIKTEHVDQ